MPSEQIKLKHEHIHEGKSFSNTLKFKRQPNGTIKVWADAGTNHVILHLDRNQQHFLKLFLDEGLTS